MLSVTGLILIHPQADINAKHLEKGSYFSFTGISKHPFKDERTSHNINIYVPKDKLTKAKELLVPNQMVFIRHGDLESYQPSPTSSIVSNVKTNWSNIEILTKTFRKDKQ